MSVILQVIKANRFVLSSLAIDIDRFNKYEHMCGNRRMYVNVFDINNNLFVIIQINRISIRLTSLLIIGIHWPVASEWFLYILANIKTSSSNGIYLDQFKILT